jgi:hypothetical protein
MFSASPVIPRALDEKDSGNPTTEHGHSLAGK